MNPELIHKYLNSEMTNQEHAAFELRMLKEPKLTEEVALQKEMIAFSNAETQAKKARHSIKEIGETYRPRQKEEGRIEESETKKSKLVYWLPISIAALFLIGFFMKSLMIPLQLSSEQIYSKYATVSQLSFTSRNADKDELLLSAQNAFNAENYNLAVSEFAKVLELNPNNAKALYYQAFAKIKIGDNNGGRKDFSILLDNSQFKNSALYQLGLSYIKTDQYNEALELFGQISSSSNHYKNVQELMKMIQ